MTSDDPFWDDTFHVIAFQAFIIEARAAQDWPDPEKTKQRAYKMFEQEIRAVDRSAEPR